MILAWRSRYSYWIRRKCHIRKLSRNCERIQKEVNPYDKYELIASLDEEMNLCVEDYYKEEGKVLEKARGSFGTDLKIPILEFCLAKSLNRNLIIDRIMIQEFVQPCYLDYTPHFIIFAGCIDQILQEDERKKSAETRVVCGSLKINSNILKKRSRPSN